MATDGKLIFIRPADGTGRLTFGDGVETPVQPTDISIDATFSDDMRCSVQMLWDANVSRGFGVQLRTSWEEAERVSNRARSHWQNSEPIVSLTQSNEQPADPVSNRASVNWQESDKLTSRTAEHWQDGAAARASLLTAWQEAEKMRASLRTWWQDADAMRHVLNAKYQETVRLRHTIEQHWQDAEHRAYLLRHRGRDGQPVKSGLGFRWQDAIRPPAGQSFFIPPPEPPEPPCYEDIGRLEFVEPWVNNGRLVFVCIRGGVDPYPPGTIVVPVRSVYMVINDSQLRRLDDSTVIPTSGATLTLDEGSWTWGFSATIPGYALSLVQRTSPDKPVGVALEINGETFHAQIESVSRSRAFNSDSLRISGRGVAAILDSPYAPAVSRSHAFDRTAQQLANEALMINGVSIGWDIEWGLTDWLVPAGVYNHYGTAIGAISAIVAAAGGYVQPHPTLQRLRLLPKYPTAPWLWGSVTPDIVLPADPVSVEGTEWVDRVAYNRVFVSGMQSGINGDATIAGTGGLLVAPPVTDQLITHADAARQRAIAELATGGRWVNRDLKLPVLEETGIILPGKFVTYNDGEIEQLGIVRSVSVQVGMPEIWQTIGVESYVA